MQAATIVERPESKAEVSYPLGGDDQAQLTRLESLEKLRELLIRYEKISAEVKKIPAKRLVNDYVGAAHTLAEIGAELSTQLQSTGLLPYKKDTLRHVEAEIVAAKKFSAATVKPAPQTSENRRRPIQVLRRTGRVQKPNREGITVYSRWAECFADLSARLPIGETRTVDRNHISRNEDGNTIETRYATTGKWAILKRATTETDTVSIEVVEARFSKYFSDGSIGESWEKETTTRFKELEVKTIDLPTAPLSKLPPRMEPRLDKWAWYDFLRQFVRINPDTMRFTIGKREYQIDQFRFKEMARRWRIVNCIGMRGQIAEPCISRMAEKAAYLHRSKHEATFDSIIEDSLPWLIGNVDYFLEVEEDELRRSKATPHFRRATATVVAQATS